MGLRILVADDHALFRAGIRRILEHVEGVEAVAEAADGEEAFRLTAEHRPQVLLVDIAMPGVDGIETVRRISTEFPHTRVIVLSMHEHEAYLTRALAAGAAGYVVKTAKPEELEDAIRAVMRGDAYLSPRMTRSVVEDYVRRARGGEAVERLSPRQREILKAIAEGLTTRGIAQKLGVSPKTVETHRAELMERLGIRDVAGLVRYAIRVGLVRPDL